MALPYCIAYLIDRDLIVLPCIAYCNRLLQYYCALLLVEESGEADVDVEVHLATVHG